MTSASTRKITRNYDYILKGHTLERTDCSKYLGVDIASDLNWKNHINRITKKGNNMLGFLRRNLKTNNKQTKTNAYFTLVRPHLEYCSSVWNPHAVEQTNSIEKVQRRAARYVMNNYQQRSSVTAMIEELEWPSLERRRTTGQLTMLYKIINNTVDIPTTPYFTYNRSRTRANHIHKINHIGTKTDTFKYSFFPRTVPLWNMLPAAVAEAPSLVSFKRELSAHSF